MFRRRHLARSALISEGFASPSLSTQGRKSIVSLGHSASAIFSGKLANSSNISQRSPRIDSPTSRLRASSTNPPRTSSRAKDAGSLQDALPKTAEQAASLHDDRLFLDQKRRALAQAPFARGCSSAAHVSLHEQE